MKRRFEWAAPLKDDKVLERAEEASNSWRAVAFLLRYCRSLTPASASSWATANSDFLSQVGSSMAYKGGKTRLMSGGVVSFRNVSLHIRSCSREVAAICGPAAGVPGSG